MSDDLPNQNNNPPHPWDTPQTPSPEPPNTPNPPNIPNPSNNVDPVQSWVAQHEMRDEHGRFVPSTPSAPPNPLIQIKTGGGGGSDNNSKDKEDDNIFEAKVKNPFSSFFAWIKKKINSEGIKINFTIKPLTAISLVTALTVGYGSGLGHGYSLGYSAGINNIAKIFFPNSSPILHREITLQGIVQRSQVGQYYLTLPDNTMWKLNALNNINLASEINKLVLIKGNMTAEANVVEVKEVISSEKPKPAPYQTYQYPPQSGTPSAQNYP